MLHKQNNFGVRFNQIVELFDTLNNYLEDLRNDIAYELFNEEKEKYYTEIEYLILEKELYKINKIQQHLRKIKIDTIGICTTPNKTPKTNIVMLATNSDDIEVYENTIPNKYLKKYIKTIL